MGENVISGTKKQVIALIEELARGTDGTPGLMAQDAWRARLNDPVRVFRQAHSWAKVQAIARLQAWPMFGLVSAHREGTMRVESNVIYGMVSGLALLMDVYYPDASNGYGLIHISGSGWNAPLGLDARPLKESPHVQIEGLPLVKAGYTLFTINHRATPRFHYPAPVEDAQRAVRFVRYHAAQYGIDPARIGALGGSSGGHLVCMLGVLDGDGDPDDESPINRLSAKVQCVVARAAPASFGRGQRGAPALFLGAAVHPAASPDSIEARRAREASPVTHVTPGDPPFFLIHGEADDVVPIAGSEAMVRALREAGVPVQFRRVTGGAHGPGLVDDPEIVDEIRAWFDRHLKEH